MRVRSAAALGAALLAAAPPAAGQGGGPAVPPAAFGVETFAVGFEHPWGAAFLPDGRLLVTERPGRLRLVGRDGAVSAPLAGVPEVLAAGQGGLLDVALAPDFAATRELYFCHAMMVRGGALTRLARARLSADAAALEDVRPLFDATPPQESGRNHYGCRIAFGADGRLFLSTGDRYRDKERAQRPDDLAGKVLRLERDGRAAAGNPFAAVPGARAEVYTLGHRNPQGLALDPRSGLLWESEFGPRGGDEVNLLRAGANHGWPLATYGIDYDGSRIGQGASRPGVAEPARVWVPSISPSGLAFYDGAAFPAWRGSLFLATLSPPGLVRLQVEGEAVLAEERVIRGGPRLRHVVPGPDGLLYLLTDESRGRVLRLRPAG